MSQNVDNMEMRYRFVTITWYGGHVFYPDGTSNEGKERRPDINGLPAMADSDNARTSMLSSSKMEEKLGRSTGSTGTGVSKWN
jgi:hypothetical protein